MRRQIFAFALAAAALASPAAGQRLAPLDDDAVDRLAAVARENITQARFADGSPVPAETAEALTRPIVPIALSRQTARRGFLSGEMEACGMAWEGSSFGPYMRALRATRRYSATQLAYLAFVHGFAQALSNRAATALSDPCSDAERKGLARAVDGMVFQTP